MQLPYLMLAPMKDVTTLGFLRTLHQYGGADHYVTEFFRVHSVSRLEPHILKLLEQNPTGRPMDAQLIGSDLPFMLSAAKTLAKNPFVRFVDLNLGCPAPVVCRKDCGGGMLRNLAEMEKLVGELRQVLPGKFTIKTRLGYSNPQEFRAILDVFSRHTPDRLVIHARTVQEKYQSAIHPEWIRLAVEELNCPVIANGNVVDAQIARNLLQMTGAAGVMVGRGAIRNPWIFSQIRGENKVVRRFDVFNYIRNLYRELCEEFPPELANERAQVRMMKRFMAYIVQGFEPEFEFEIRRAVTEVDFWATCEKFLIENEELANSPAPILPQENSRLFCGFSELKNYNPISSSVK